MASTLTIYPIDLSELKSNPEQRKLCKITALQNENSNLK